MHWHSPLTGFILQPLLSFLVGLNVEDPYTVLLSYVVKVQLCDLFTPCTCPEQAYRKPESFRSFETLPEKLRRVEDGGKFCISERISLQPFVPPMFLDPQAISRIEPSLGYV